MFSMQSRSAITSLSSDTSPVSTISSASKRQKRWSNKNVTMESFSMPPDFILDGANRMEMRIRVIDYQLYHVYIYYDLTEAL